ncbi:MULTISPECIES: 30S ribosome-binding factor RbfA [unclassified Candidatus Cardinium]|uniref:30S ribosome-binding factor RbfA n=1 Tax=unclassified Candidatus Cardinium TaxID=2641185 RepID=UPI001FB28CAF|nr:MULTISPECIES: 30S ribosome-binding factor RbfA [unclassified Candidatus Cardinium]
MIKPTNVIKIKQIAKILQKELATLFLTEMAGLFDHALISVTMVDLSSDLNLAKVYMSLSLNKDQGSLLKKMDDHKNSIRRSLGKRIAGKIHKVPDLRFILDDSVIQGARVTALIDQLDLIEG